VSLNNQSNLSRVKRILDALDLIEVSAKSNRASPDDVAALLRPVTARLVPPGASPTPQTPPAASAAPVAPAGAAREAVGPGVPSRDREDIRQALADLTRDVGNLRSVVLGWPV